MSSDNGHESRVVLTDGGRMVPPMSSAQLSASERSRLTDAMVAQLQALTGQVNVLTKDVGQLARLQAAHVETLRTEIAAGRDHAQMRHWEFVGRRWLARLRWMVTGQ
jgi:hypothetical protein